ncbi:hypothetical protein D1007_10804 [Hordeum vulgare]|nr:hypothetical protein D1007_10804 [Hordeum vulgare]
MGVEDGQRFERHHRPARAPVADLGCRGMPQGGRSRDQDEDGGQGGGGHRSSKDVLLRCGRSQAPSRAAPAPRHRSRSPPVRRSSKESAGRRQGAGRAPASARHQLQQRRARPPPPPLARRAGSKAADRVVCPDAEGDRSGIDPIEDFFKTTKKPTLASVIVDSMAADVHTATEAVVAAPLEFDEEPLLHAAVEAVQLDAFSPTLSVAASDVGQYSRATPMSARTMEVQLGAVTGRVSHLELGAAVDLPETHALFRASKQPLISVVPARRPPKSRASSTTTRHNTRQAANASTVPVAQRASLRLVKELGMLGPRDKMTEEVSKALLHSFEEPLSDNDIAVIARLTRLDGEAVRVMARMVGPEGVVEEATV